MAFQLYEHEDMLGLAIDEHVLLRTLKVSSCSFSLREPRGRGGGGSDIKRMGVLLIPCRS